MQQTLAPMLLPPKKIGNLKYFIIALAVLAVAGIGFGVYEYAQFNRQSAEIKSLKEEITQLKQSAESQDESFNQDYNQDSQSTEAQPENQENNNVPFSKSAVSCPSAIGQSSIIDVQRPINPRSVPAGSEDEWQYEVSSSNPSWQINISEDQKTVSVKVDNEYTSAVGLPETAARTYTTTFNTEVASVLIQGNGQMAGTENVIFLMKDGTVEYIPMKSALENNSFQSNGKVAGVEDVVMLQRIKVILGTGYAEVAGVKCDGSFYLINSLI